MGKRKYCNISLLLLFAILQGTFCFADYEDSLEYLLLKTSNPEHQLEILLKIGERKLIRGDHNCINYTERAIVLADSLNFREKIAESKYLSGLAWRLCGDNSTSIIRLFNAADIFNEMKQQNKYASALREVGETYRANGNHLNSLEFLKTALQVQIELDDSAELSKTYNRLAAVNYEVIFYRDDYLKITKSNNPTVTAVKNVIERDTELKSCIDSTIQYIDLSDSYAQKLNQKETILSNRIIRGALYSAIFDFEKADSTLNLALLQARSAKNDAEESLILYNYGRLKLNQVKYDEAIEYLLKAYGLAKKTDTKIYKLITSQLLGELYQKVNKPLDAIKFMNISQNEISYFYKNDLGLRVNALQYQHELDKHKANLLLQATKTRYLVYFFAYILTLFALFTIVIYIKNKKLKKLNLQLERKSHTISIQNSELVTLNAEKDKFFSIIAHDLRGPLGTFVSIMDIMTEELRKNRIDKVQLLADNLQIVAYHLYGLLENLLDWSKIQRNAIIYTPRDIDLLRFIQDSTMIMLDSALNKKVKIEYHIPENIAIKTDPHMLQTIVRNLTTNAIKFTHEGGMVRITAESKEKLVVISVEDTGIGMDSEMIGKLFTLNNEANRLGTNHEPSSGLGLLLCKDFVEKMGGSITVESEVDKGSRFKINLPQ